MNRQLITISAINKIEDMIMDCLIKGYQRNKILV